MTVEEKIENAGYDSVMVFSNNEYDTAFLGVTEDERAVYDYDLMVKWLVENGGGMTEMDAVEWIDFNVIRALPYYKNSPIILYRLEDE